MVEDNKKQYKDPKTSKKAFTNCIAGAIGGAGSTPLSHPLDSVKVKLQTFPNLYSGGIHCIREVTRQEGVKGLYRGLTPNVILSMTEASIRYSIYGVCQDMVRIAFGAGSSEQMRLSHNAAAGGLTGVLATFVSCPVELVKCRMQGMLELTQTGEGTVKRRGPVGVASHILRTEGVRGLYHGFSSNVARNLPGEMVFFATYEQARSLLRRPGQVKDDLGPLGSFVAGSCAGSVYWCSIYPLDVVKSRMQVLSAQGRVQSLLQTAATILKTEGVRAMYHGVGYSIPRACIGSGSHFVFYEAVRKLLLKRES